MGVAVFQVLGISLTACLFSKFKIQEKYLYGDLDDIEDKD